MSDSPNIYQLAESLHNSGDNRQALEILDEARKAGDFNGQGSDAFDELRQRILAAMRAISAEAQAELQAAFQDANKVDVDRAQSALDQWQRNTPDASDPILAYYRKTVEDYYADRSQREVFDRVNTEAERLWAQGEHESQVPSTTTARILTYFTQARNLVQSAAALHPDYAPLQVLLERANARRARIAQEEEILLSGAQIEKISAAIRHIDKTSNDEYVLVFDETGASQGRMPKSEARRQYERNARRVVGTALNLYIENARQQFNQGLPRGAQEALNERHKFDELQLLVPNLLTDDKTREIAEWERKIAEAARLLARAEEGAEGAAAIAQTPNEALVAYRAYQSAVSIYEGAHHSGIVQNAERAISEAMRRDLNDQIALMDALGKVESPREYFTRDILGEIIRSGSATLARYTEEAKDLPIRDRLERLQRIVEQAQQIQSRISNLNSDLADIENRLANDPRGADRQLRDLEFGVEKPLLEAIPRYTEIRSKINMRINQQSELSRLRSFLNHPDAEQVRQAMELARQQSANSHEYSDEFNRLALNLQAYYTLLRADSTIRTSGYDTALEELAPFNEAEAIDTELRERIQSKYEQLTADAREIGDDRARLQSAEQFFKDQKFEDAYLLLRDLKHFANSREREYYRRLKNDTQAAWAAEIYQRLLGLNIETEIDLHKQRSDVQALMEIAPERYNALRQRLSFYESVQIVRNDINSGNFEHAREQLEIVKRNASASEQLYVDGLNNRINHEIIREEKQTLIDGLPSAVRDASRLTTELTKLINLTDRLAKLVGGTRDLIAKIRFSAWQIELLIEHGQYTTDAAARRDLFNRAYAAGLNLEADTQLETAEPRNSAERIPALAEADRMIRRALAAPPIGAAVQQVEQYMKPSERFETFRDAVETWNATFIPYKEDFVRLGDWYQENQTWVYNAITAEIGAIQQSGGRTIEISDLPQYAKLLILNPEDKQGKRMLSDLPGLTERLQKDVNNLRDEVVGKHGYAPTALADSFELIQRQVDSLINRRDSVELLRAILKSFAASPQSRGDGASPETIVGRLLAGLNDDIERMRRFQARINDFRAFLDNFSLTSDEDRNWENSDEQFDDQWDSFLTTIDNIGREGARLADHPVLTGLRDQMETKRTHIRDIVTGLRDLRAAIADEDFELASSRLENMINAKYERDLEKMPLYDQYGVRDVWRDIDVIGWANVRTLVTQRAGWQKSLFAWMRPFNVPQDLLPEAVETFSNGAPPNVVDWDKTRQHAEADLSIGEFDTAYRRLLSARDDGDGQRLGIAEAVRLLVSPPLADVGGFTDRYEEAIRHAGSLRGERLLRWTQLQRYQKLRAALDELNRMIQESLDKKTLWNRLATEFAGFTNRMNDVIAEKRRFRGVDTKALQSLVDQADQTLVGMRKISGKHSKLSIYENDPDYKQAQALVSRGKR